MFVELIVALLVLIFAGSLVLGLLKLVFGLILLPIKLALLLTKGLLALVIGLPLLLLGGLRRLRLLLRGRVLGLRLGERQHGAGQQKHQGQPQPSGDAACTNSHVTSLPIPGGFAQPRPR